MEGQNDFVEVTEIISNPGSSQIYAQDKSSLETQMEIAARRPRDLSRAIRNAITIATMTPEIADKCIYTLKKGKTIIGPSVNLARILIQQLGNIRIENRVLGY